jgi:hypothetical protein
MSRGSSTLNIPTAFPEKSEKTVDLNRSFIKVAREPELVEAAGAKFEKTFDGGAGSFGIRFSSPSFGIARPGQGQSGKP